MVGIDFVRPFADLMQQLFKGHPEHFGVWEPPKEKCKEGEKNSGRSWTEHKPLGQDQYCRHLHGEQSIGVLPLDANGNIRFAAIDVDVYPLEPHKYIALLRQHNLPFVAFKSKSGGLHLMIFFSEDTKAAKALPVLHTVRRVLGLPRDTEIFPKQRSLSKGQTGSWLNLPYYNHKSTERYAYDANSQPLSLEEGLAYGMRSRTTLKVLSTALEQLMLCDGPPCLQTLLSSGEVDKGARNVFLFNCATYFKAKYKEEFAEHLHMINGQIPDPLKYTEVDTTIVSSHNKGDYSYQCNDGVLARYCDRTECGMREFGKGSGTVSDLSFERLVQVKCAQPYYKWYVNGAELTFYSESELIKQDKFRELCLRVLHKLPNRLKEQAWTNVINRALTNIEIENVELVDDLSTNSIWISKLSEFLESKRALRPSQVETGLVWRAGSIMHFKGAKLMEHLDKTGMFRHFKGNRHRDLLKTLGAKPGTKLRYPDLKKSARVWAIDLKETHKDGMLLSVPVEEIKVVHEDLNFKPEEERF